MESSITIERPKTRIIIHKGATISTGQYSNERFDYTIDSEVPAELMPSILDDVDAVIDEKVSKQKTAITTQITKTTAANTTDLNSLPWRKYKDSSGEWLFADTKGAEKLLAQVTASNGVWQDENFVYRLSKPESGGRRFIRRFPKRR
jgi:hypothetical protein